MEFVDLMGLSAKADHRADSLAYGEARRLEIARALAGRPLMLLLDEPSLGLAPILVAQVFEKIKEINSQGTTVLLVEQNAQAALEIADRGYVLEAGQLTLQGPAAQLLADPSLRAAYLGG